LFLGKSEENPDIVTSAAATLGKHSETKMDLIALEPGYSAMSWRMQPGHYLPSCSLLTPQAGPPDAVGKNFIATPFMQ
jgi:hypothetical protein